MPDPPDRDGLLTARGAFLAATVFLLGWALFVWLRWG